MLQPLRSLRFALALVTASAPLLLAGGGGGDDAAEGGGGGDGAGNVGGSGGSGGQANACSLDAELGAPLDLPKDAWTWVDVPESLCMNGEATGIAVNPSSTSNKVAIVLMGGNACFNTASCAVTANRNGYNQTEWDADADNVRMAQFFDRADADNPLKDFSFVFVPYCSGDVHAGNKAGEMVGGSVRTFNGSNNMTAYLKRLVPTFADAEQILLTGVSAGGFGAAMNYDKVASAFCNTDVVLIDDSGPPMGEEYLAACLQQHMVDTWGLDTTLPDDCADCRPANGAFAEPFVKYLITKYADRTLGVISSEGDSTISQFWSFGENDCANINGLPGSYAASKYKAGLEDLRDRIVGSAAGNFGLFMVPGTEHVFLDNDPTSVVVNGVTLKDWLIQALNNDPAFGNVP